MEFSILILTYHPVWEKLKITLESVLLQSYTDFEIVITDDGSEDNCFAQIQEYFRKKNYTDYTLIPHKKNQGTVKNIISGLEHCKGRFIRDFGPGDFFYSEKSLEELHSFMVSSNCDVCFGLMRGYYKNEIAKIICEDFCRPYDIEAYKQNNRKRIQKNLVLHTDNPSGASMCYQREFFYEYMKRIEDTVIYTEDIAAVIAALDEKTIQFYPKYLVWYESDGGLSTKKKNNFSKLLSVDKDRFYNLLQMQYPDNSLVIKQRKLLKTNLIENIFLRRVCRVLAAPDIIRLYLSHLKQKRHNIYVGDNHERSLMENSDFVKLFENNRI